MKNGEKVNEFLKTWFWCQKDSTLFCAKFLRRKVQFIFLNTLSKNPFCQANFPLIDFQVGKKAQSLFQKNEMRTKEPKLDA